MNEDVNGGDLEIDAGFFAIIDANRSEDFSVREEDGSEEFIEPIASSIVCDALIEFFDEMLIPGTYVFEFGLEGFKDHRFTTILEGFLFGGFINILENVEDRTVKEIYELLGVFKFSFNENVINIV